VSTGGDRAGAGGTDGPGDPGGLGGERLRQRDAELAGEGWARRFVGGPPRLQEAKELYESLGLEVHMEPLRAEELHGRCGDCTLALTFFRVVYTRRSG